MAQLAAEKHIEGLKLKKLDVAQLRSYISVTAGINFDLFTNLKEDHSRIVAAIQARGASSVNANRIVARDGESQITTYPPTDGVNRCAVVFPDAIVPGSLAEKSPAMRAIYAESEQGKLLRKFAAYHEGAHCGQLPLMKELGIQVPVTDLGRTFAINVAEAYSDAVATMTYLRDLAKVSGDAQSLARKTLADFIELKFNSAPKIGALALDLVQALLELPQGQFNNLKDDEIKRFARELIIDNAGDFLDRLRKTGIGPR